MRGSSQQRSCCSLHAFCGAKSVLRSTGARTLGPCTCATSHMSAASLHSCAPLPAFRRSQLHCPFRGQCNCSLAQLFAKLRFAKSCAASCVQRSCTQRCFATLLPKARRALGSSSVYYRPKGPSKLSEASPRLLTSKSAALWS